MVGKIALALADKHGKNFSKRPSGAIWQVFCFFVSMFCWFAIVIFDEGRGLLQDLPFDLQITKIVQKGG